MSVSRFFCQNLLSDYVEKLLPASRHAEVKQCLDEFPECQDMHKDLVSTVKLLNAVPIRDISNDVALRIMEASESARGKRNTRLRVVQVMLFILVPFSIVALAAAIYPKSIPVVSRMLASTTSSTKQFSRYYPLYHGAEEILQSQGAVIQQAESLSGSVWEEGGLSPEEFERTFQLQSGISDEK